MRATVLTLAAVFVGAAGMAGEAAERKVAVKFAGGHETDRKDGGRPCVLIAAALGVKTEVFREAFRGVTPAKNGRPSGEEARRNKEALMKVLAPHGVTNDRLDEVSNYYRYRPQEGELWPTKPAKAQATIVDGKVTKIEVTESGSGYSSPPTATIEGLDVRLTVKVKYGKELKTNGAVTAVEVTAEEKSR